MNVSIAVIIAAVIVAAAILGTVVVAPYRLSASVAAGGDRAAWRLNTRTGEVTLCREVIVDLPADATSLSDKAGDPWSRLNALLDSSKASQGAPRVVPPQNYPAKKATPYSCE